MIGYAGLSHLGIVSAVAAAEKGFDVVAYDTDASVCAQLAEGKAPVMEPGLPELLLRNRARIRFTSDASALSSCDVAYVSVDVPTTDDHRSDVSPVRALLTTVADVAKPGAVLIILSQVPPGFTRAMRPVVENEGEKALTLLYQVETLAFGAAVERALKPERFIMGCLDPAEPLPGPVATFFGAFGCPVLPMRYESAELCKISINMFLAASLSTTNLLAELCEAIGAEWREIVPALRLDRRIGPHAYLGAGLGIGGGNITRDLAAVRELAHEHGIDAEVVDAWLRQSGSRRDWALRTLHRDVLSRVERPVIAVWGLAYKEHTRSTKNSPALNLIGQLRGYDLRVFDPEVDAREIADVIACLDPLATCDGADALVVMTPWPQFADVDLRQVRRRMRGLTIVDPFGCLDGQRAQTLGFEYRRLGTGVLRPEEVSA